ncbi:M15 family metallopeptidase [Vibrio sp. SCSIO 43140]|uniref:M15 family metallopeptidase n=1 Tax=Vibrio sp. SCSIO 43140 TaxID=2819100 RepID=UPI0020762406|nr:M15 family metallopeptidase [Vibrio sp. SCSIO 43140]USD59786.1 M15 family metallopeptidase [Vibrio sp. SCSIO 43140]
MEIAHLVGQSSDSLVDITIGNRTFLVHPDASRDLGELVNAAKSAGFDLYLASGYRSFERQLAIWNAKMSGAKPILDANSVPMNVDSLSEAEKVAAILKWSALPGASRHHWGTDFDVYAGNLLPADTTLQLEPWEYLDGHQRPFYHWLKQHADSYGFFFPYAKDNGGVAMEPWHISHRASASDCLDSFSCEKLGKVLKQSDILGQEPILSKLDSIYNQYVTNINR